MPSSSSSRSSPGACGSAEKINIAYEALEKMRLLELELECSKHGIKQVDPKTCTSCLLAQKKVFSRLDKFVQDVATVATPKMERSPGFMMRSFMGRKLEDEKKEHTAAAPTQQGEPRGRVVLPRIQNLVENVNRARSSLCLLCASPCCRMHASATFRKEGITLCQSCEQYLDVDYAYSLLLAPPDSQQNNNDNSLNEDRARYVDRMMDMYDRSLLLLRYSSRFIEDVAAGLEQQTKKENKIGLSSSGAGVVSGALGVAAAATVLTPVGAPLLVSSLLFGGGATVLQTGTQAVHYASEPNKLADRIIALHGVLQWIQAVISTILHHQAVALAAEKTDSPTIRVKNATTTSTGDQTSPSTADKPKGNDSLFSQPPTEKSRASFLVAGATSFTFGSALAEAGAAEVGTAASRSAMAASRMTVAAARTLRFAGGALSAAVLLWEVHAARSILENIRNGNPCEKAQVLRKVQQDLQTMPSTALLEELCQSWLLSARTTKSVPEATSVKMEQSAPSMTTEAKTPPKLSFELLPSLAQGKDKPEETAKPDTVSTTENREPTSSPRGQAVETPSPENQQGGETAGASDDASSTVDNSVHSNDNNTEAPSSCDLCEIETPTTTTSVVVLEGEIVSEDEILIEEDDDESDDEEEILLELEHSKEANIFEEDEGRQQNIAERQTLQELAETSLALEVKHQQLANMPLSFQFGKEDLYHSGPNVSQEQVNRSASGLSPLDPFTYLQHSRAAATCPPHPTTAAQPRMATRILDVDSGSSDSSDEEFGDWDLIG